MDDPTLQFEVEGLGLILDRSNEDRLKRTALKLMSERYLAFLLRRFVNSSRGGGEWPPLALKTIKARRKGVKIKKGNAEQVSIGHHFKNVAILTDTGTLRNALDINKRFVGSERKISVVGSRAEVTVGFSRSMMHPPPTDRRKDRSKPRKPGTPITISELAAIHHYGNTERNLPARPILVKPDAMTVRKLEKILEEEMKKQYEIRRD